MSDSGVVKVNFFKLLTRISASNQGGITRTKFILSLETTRKKLINLWNNNFQAISYQVTKKSHLSETRKRWVLRQPQLPGFGEFPDYSARRDNLNRASRTLWMKEQRLWGDQGNWSRQGRSQGRESCTEEENDTKCKYGPTKGIKRTGIGNCMGKYQGSFCYYLKRWWQKYSEFY